MKHNKGMSKCFNVFLEVKFTEGAYLPTFGNQKSGHLQHCSNNPPPPDKNQSFPSNPSGSMEAENLIDRALHSTAKSTSHSYVRLRSIKYISPQFAEKNRPGKILIYVLNIILKTGTLPAEILENQYIPIFGGFESQKSGLS